VLDTARGSITRGRSLAAIRWAAEVRWELGVDPQISEFSYGYALTSELMARFGLKALGAPEFATQYAEGKDGGGWDLKLPTIPVYLQFKRSHRMVRRSAKEEKYFPKMPFYRMYLHRRHHSDQHKLLLDLEKKGNLVRYAAPGFTNSSELNDAYSADRVASVSLFVRPSKIGALKDDNSHWVAFQTAPRMAYFCSDPRPVEVEAPEELFSAIAGELASTRGRVPDEGFLSAIADELLEVYARRRETPVERERIARIRRVRERRSPAQFAQLVSQTLFDCELLFYQAG
jgi:hypothetical protein